MNFTRSFLIATVAVGAMTLTACGKKKDEPKDLGTPAPAAPAPTQPTTPGQAPQAPVQQQQPGIPAPIGAAGGAPVAGNAPVDRQGSMTRAEEPGQRSSRTQKNKEGLVFTGSASDNTLEILKRRESALSSSQQQQNKNLAQSIEEVYFSQDTDTQEAIVSVRLKEGKHSEVYNVISSPLVDNTVVSARLVGSALGLRTSGNKAVSGTAQCLDLDMNTSGNRCNNVLISLRVNKSTAQILVRSNYADLVADLKDSSGNPEFEVLKDLLMNSYLDRDTKNKIDSINMLTYEIVNGRAGFDLQVIGLNKEYIGFRGDLLSSQAGSAVNVAVEKTSPRLNSGVRGTDDLSLKLLNTLGIVRLVKNDGNGQVILKASSRAYKNYPVDSFTLSFTRRATAVISLDVETLK